MTSNLCRHGHKIMDDYICKECNIQILGKIVKYISKMVLNDK